MASQALKQRTKHDQPPPITATDAATNAATRRKMAMAKKGLRSLALAVLVPLILTALSAYFSGCSVPAAGKDRRASWLSPPVWAFHLASITTSSLMGFSAWLVWAEGAFHRNPTLLPLYSAQVLLGLLWGPAVFGLGWPRAGLVMCVMSMMAMFACAERFRKVNPIAGELVKPCLAWMAFVAVYTYKLI